MAIQFCFPDIPIRAHTVKYDSVENNNILSLINGGSRSPIKFDQNTSPVDFKYDLQSDPHACDFVIFSHDYLEGFPTITTIDVDHSPDDSAWTEADSSTFSSNLYGRDSFIYYKAFSEVSAKQYWRCEVTFSGSYNVSSDDVIMHKLFLGTKFAFTNPVSILKKEYRKRHINFKTSSGIDIVTASGFDGMNLNLQVVCTNAEKEAFFAKNIGDVVYLYDADDLMLDGHKLIYFKINELNSEHHKTGNNLVNINLLEVA